MVIHVNTLLHKQISVWNRKQANGAVRIGHGTRIPVFCITFRVTLFIKKGDDVKAMKLLIRNMVSLRCKMIVKSVLEKLGHHSIIVELGEVEISEDLTPKEWEILKTSLLHYGLELMEDRKSILIEKIKNIIVEMIHYSDEPPALNFSNYLSSKLGYEYNYLSNLFSEVKGTTIEHYIIAHKIERAKELLIYNELSLTEIAATLHYSNVAHLSNQFKKVTGLTPSFFKKMKHKRLIALENL